VDVVGRRWPSPRPESSSIAARAAVAGHPVVAELRQVLGELIMFPTATV